MNPIDYPQRTLSDYKLSIPDCNEIYRYDTINIFNS